MSQVTYTSKVRIVRQTGPVRLAYLPAETVPIAFGTHGAIAAHYGYRNRIPDPHATTIDYVVAATGG